MSTLAIVEQILRDTHTPLSVREIVERAGASLPTKSKTPDTVVARDLSMDIKKKGESSLFIRTSPGRYTMRDSWISQQQNPPSSVTPVLSSAMQQERAATMSSRSVSPSKQKRHEATGSSPR